MATVQRVRRLLFIFTVCSSFIAATLSILNLEEIQNSKYGIEIKSSPVLLREDSHLSNSMLISSKHGQQYQCTLPQLESEEKIKDSRTNFTTEEITDLLKLMENKCLYLNKGWWTYEFCYGKSVSQYHEEGNLVTGEKISLGVYSSQTDWSKEKIELPYSKNSSKRFHSQFFENGTKCDLNGEHRKTEVKFKCELDVKDRITMVDEPSSCTYVVLVQTDKICNHPLFKPATDRKPLAITCSPALSQEHYQTYLTSVELEKKAKAKAIADKIRKMQASDEEEEEDSLDDDLGENKKRKPYRSELWPWNKPGVESNDETWISGNIDKKTMGVSRMDIIKGRKMVNDEEKVDQERTFTIMSRGMNKDRKPVENKPDAVENKQKKSTEQEQQVDESSNVKKEEQQQDKEKGVPIDDEVKDRKQSEDGQTEHEKEGQNDDMKLGIFTPSSSSKIIGKIMEVEEAKKVNNGDGQVDSDTSKQQGGKDGTAKNEKPNKKKSLEEEWKEALTKATAHFKSVVRKQLKGMGVDPDELEEKVKVMKGYKGPKESSVDKNSEVKEDKVERQEDEKSKIMLDPSMDGLKAALDQKLEKLMQSVTQMEREGKLEKNSKERRVLTNIKKIMQGMDHQNVLLMKKEETLQREMEKHFEELRDRFDMEVTMMKKFIDDIEERGIDAAEGEEEDYLKSIVEKLKKSVLRFDVSNKALSKDMEAVKELNKEVHSKIDNLVEGDDANRKKNGPDFFRLAAKANLLLRRLLQRSAQLDRDMKAMKEISEDIKARKDDYFDEIGDDKNVELKENIKLKREAELRLGSIVQKLKKMFKGLDDGGPETGGQTDIFGNEDPIENQELDSKGSPSISDDNIRVRVSKIKGDDGKTTWSEDDEEKGDNKIGEEMGIEERLKRASKRMEKLVKKQLKNAGISPGGKIRVKIITSRDALENFRDSKGMQILSDEETNQFKDMIMNLMGGSTEAGNERKRQAELESNYNLVWGDNKMKRAPQEEEEPDAELVFDDTEF